MLNGVHETQGESVNLAAFRVLQTCFQEISVADIDYCYRVLVKLLREEHQRYIYKNRSILRQTEAYASVFY